MYKLSIIIPHYNSADSLDRLLTSIPLEDNSIQVIIVDDKSRAEELKKVKELYRRLKYNLLLIENTSEKKGAGVCRNIGLSHAAGKWILFADADDFFMPDFYKHVQPYLNQSFDVVYFPPTSVEESSMKQTNRHEQYSSLVTNYLNRASEYNETMLRYKFFVPWSKLFKKSFLMKNTIDFDETLVANDVMFSTKAGYAMKSFEVSGECIYCWTQKKGTLTTLINEEAYDTRLAVYIQYCTFLSERLGKQQMNWLNVSGRGYIVTGIKHQFNLLKLSKIIYELRKHHIRIFGWKYLNPIYFMKRVSFNYGVYKNEKDYYSK